MTTTETRKAFEKWASKKYGHAYGHGTVDNPTEDILVVFEAGWKAKEKETIGKMKGAALGLISKEDVKDFVKSYKQFKDGKMRSGTIEDLRKAVAQKARKAVK